MMLNQMMTTPNTAVAVPSQLPTTQTKDTQWLTLEVCREFQRNKCTRSDTECKYAHPPPHVEVQNGRVTACFDSIKGKCQRKEPPCKYLHPPQHLKEVLLQNGRRNLILKNSMISPYLSMPTYVHPGYTPVYRHVLPTVKVDPSKEIMERNQALLQVGEVMDVVTLWRADMCLLLVLSLPLVYVSCDSTKLYNSLQCLLFPFIVFIKGYVCKGGQTGHQKIPKVTYPKVINSLQHLLDPWLLFNLYSLYFMRCVCHNRQAG